MTLRNTSTLSTNFLEDFRTYPSDHDISHDTYWVGFKVDTETKLILDIKWWHEDIKSTAAKDLESLSFKHLGDSYSESIQNEFENACSRS
jgi:hypothetical protein